MPQADWPAPILAAEGEGQRIVVAMLLRDRGPTGVQTHVRVLRSWFQDQGRSVEVVTPFDAPGWARVVLFAMIAARRLLSRLASSWAVQLYVEGHAWCLRHALRRQLAEAKAAVIYAQCPISASVALQLRVPSRIPVVLAVHFNDSLAQEWVHKGEIAPGGRVYRHIDGIEANSLPNLDGLVFVSRYMEGRLLQRHPGCESLPRVVVPNFVPAPDPAVAGGLMASQRDLICIGTLEPRKNQRYLLDILAAARTQGRRLTLTLIGDGPDRASLRRRARELGIEDLVHFAGFVPLAASHIHAHRALAHVAHLENLPLAPIEAMACGKPVFAVPGGGTGEVVEDGATGLHLPADDAAQAASIILQALDDAAKMAEMGEKARDRYEVRFSPERVASRLHAFLMELGSTRQPGSWSPAPSPGASNALGSSIGQGTRAEPGSD